MNRRERRKAKSKKKSGYIKMNPRTKDGLEDYLKHLRW
tara:strand:+ start:145 stop:258 length:114 start_codon:yes stop_codon:yes gene_type:complete